MSDDERQPWDRQVAESSKAYHHFCLYRDMGPDRSVRRMANIPGCTSVRRQLNRWSSRWRWVERCRQYDDHLERQARLEQEKERREMMKRHAKIAVLGENVVVKGMEKLLAEIEQGSRSPTASDLGRLLDVAVRVERLSRGEPTEISELGGSDEHPVRVNIEERARLAVERALGITDQGPVERVEAEEAADIPAVPDPLGE
jgi:hypothetical protein